jgi:hypothetical protein
MFQSIYDELMVLNQIEEALALSLEFTIDEKELLRAREQFIMDVECELV